MNRGARFSDPAGPAPSYRWRFPVRPRRRTLPLPRLPSRPCPPPARLRRFRALRGLLARDLQALFDEQNRLLFGGRLPRCAVRWSPRLKVAGQIVREEGLIRLGLEYHCHYPGDVLSTLRHEMVHLVHWDHDAAFRRECLRVGAAVRCRTYPGIFRPWKYLYQCPTCGARRAVRRKIRAACRGCGRGARRDAARARLRLVEYLA